MGKGKLSRIALKSYSQAPKQGLTRRDLSHEELSIVDEWADDEYVGGYEKDFGHDIGAVGLIRAAQQGKKFKDSVKYQVKGDILESLISRGESECGIIYRGIEMPERQLSRYTDGYVFDQKGTSSWSSDRDWSARFAIRRDIPGVPVMFRLEGGGRALDMSRLSRIGESEWVVSKDRKFEQVGDPMPFSINGIRAYEIVVKMV